MNQRESSTRAIPTKELTCSPASHSRPCSSLLSLLPRMLKTPSRKAITSGSLTTVPDESVFIKYLTKVLSENDKLYLSSEDLFYEVKRAVVNNSDQTPLYGEIAKVGDEGGTFVFIQRNK